MHSLPATQLPKPAFSRRTGWTADSAISFLMQQAVENPRVVSLAAGLVDPGSLPVAAARAAAQQLLADDERSRQALQYGTTAGSELLRTQLLRHLADLEGCTPGELELDADQLVLTTGSQQFLSLLTQALLDPGDICLVASPTYFVFLSNVTGVGARAVGIGTDEDGMQPEALEAELQRLETAGELDRVKLIYLVSYYENPSGYSLSADRRETILEIAREWSREQRIIILEDAAYRELQYDGANMPSVWSFDSTRETVALTQTFSKSFCPGLRVGFGVLPKDLVQPICDLKGNEDFGSANFNQHLLSTVFQQGLYPDHVDEVRTAYRIKRDAMLKAADAYFSDVPGVHWVHPEGGLYVWMTVPETVDTSFDGPLFKRAVHTEQVMYVPGDLFYADPENKKPHNRMRLSYGVEDPGGIALGMQRLASALKHVLS